MMKDLAETEKYTSRSEAVDIELLSTTKAGELIPTDLALSHFSPAPILT